MEIIQVKTILSGVVLFFLWSAMHIFAARITNELMLVALFGITGLISLTAIAIAMTPKRDDD